MNTDVLISYFPLYKEAFFLTVKIGFMGIGLSFIIGLLIALIIYLKIPVLKAIAVFYVEFFRNTPLLVQLFFLYFGLPKLGIPIDAKTAGVMGLGLLGAAYMAETIRSALESVEKTQTESAQSLGLSAGQTFFNITLPISFGRGFSGIIANVIFLLKETSVFSAISLMDLMFTAKDLIGLYYKTTECLFLLVVFYLIMLLPVSIIGSIVEKKVRYAEFGI